MTYQNPPREWVNPEPGGPGPTRNKWVVVGAVGVLLLGILIGCAGRGVSAAGPVSVVTVTETASPVPAPTVTVTETASPAPAPTASATASPTTDVVPTEPANASSEGEEMFKMPKIAGMNLQDAQDLLQTLGSYLMDQEDATGLGRWQIDDSNWKVCLQKPKAGKVVPISTIVEASAVKLDERCP